MPLNLLDWDCNNAAAARAFLQADSWPGASEFQPSGIKVQVRSGESLAVAQRVTELLSSKGWATLPALLFSNGDGRPRVQYEETKANTKAAVRHNQNVRGAAYLFASFFSVFKWTNPQEYQGGMGCDILVDLPADYEG